MNVKNHFIKLSLLLLLGAVGFVFPSFSEAPEIPSAIQGTHAAEVFVDAYYRSNPEKKEKTEAEIREELAEYQKRDSQLKTAAEAERSKANEAIKEVQNAEAELESIKAQVKKSGIDINDEKSLLNSEIGKEYLKAVDKKEQADKNYSEADRLALEREAEYAALHQKMMAEQNMLAELTREIDDIWARAEDLEKRSEALRENKDEMSPEEFKQQQTLLTLELNLLARDMNEIAENPKYAYMQKTEGYIKLKDEAQEKFDRINKNVKGDDAPAFVGDPVHIASGSFYYSYEDTSFNYGINTFSLRRTYMSNFNVYGMFGPGWISPLDACLVFGEGTDTIETYKDLAGLQQEFLNVLPKLEGFELLSVQASVAKDFVSEKSYYLDTLKQYELEVLDAQQKNEAKNFYIPQQMVNALKDYGTNSIIFVNGLGSIEVFIFDGTKSQYSSVFSGSYIKAKEDGFVLYLENGITQTFNTYGKPVSITDRFGVELDFVYDESYRLKQITHNGRVMLSFTYREGKLCDVYNAVLQKHTAYSYSANMLQKVQNEDGFSSVYGYNSDGLLCSVTKPDGSTMLSEYALVQGTASRRVLSTVNEEGFAEYFYKTEDGVRYVDADGFCIDYELKDGLITKETHPDGKIIERTYDDYGKLVKEKNAFYTVLYEYDDKGNLIRASYDDWSTEEWLYNSANCLVRYKDRDGIVTSYVYDDKNFCTEINIGNTNLLRLERNDWGGIKTLVQQGEESTFEYDENYNVIKTDSAEYAYDKNRLTQIKDYKNQKYTYSYDEENRTVTLNYPTGDKRIITSDTRGNTIRQVTQDSKAGISYIEGFEYNRQNMLTKYLQGTCLTGKEDEAVLKAVQSFYYTPSGNIEKTIRWNSGAAAINDAAGVCTAYTYLAPDVLGSQEKFFVDAAGNKIKDGTRYDYNIYYSGSKRVAEASVNGIYAGTFYTDCNGHIIKTVDAEGRTAEYVYSSGGRLLKSISERGGVVNYSYDSVSGDLVYVSDADGIEHEYGWDLYGRLVSDREIDGLLTRYSYKTESGVRILETVSQARRSIVKADLDGQYLSSEIFKNDGELVLGEYFSYDTKNKKVSVYDGEVQNSMHYDSLGKINQADGFDYYESRDLNGNVIYRREGKGETLVETFISYNAYNKVSNITDTRGGCVDYFYDECGNVLRIADSNGTIWQGTYDDKKNLVSEEGRLMPKMEYGYDKSSNLVWAKQEGRPWMDVSYSKDLSTVQIKYAQGKTHLLLFDTFGRPVLEKDTDGKTRTWSYDTKSGKVVSAEKSGKTFTYITDRLGGSYSVQSSSGLFRKTFVDPLGSVTKAETEENSICFEYDSSHRLKTVYDGISEASYSYNALGLKSDVDLGGEKFHYEYDGLGRVTRISSSSGAYRTYSYSSFPEWTESRDSYGNVYYRQFDSSLRLVLEEQKNQQGKVLFAQSSLYDKNGRVKMRLVKQDEKIEFERYGYDIYGNIISLDSTYCASYAEQTENLAKEYGFNVDSYYSPSKITFDDDEKNFYDGFIKTYGTSLAPEARCWTERFEYDDGGNRTKRITPTVSFVYSYDSASRLLAVRSPKTEGCVLYEYDANGNLVLIEALNKNKKFLYNDFNQLEGVVITDLKTDIQQSVTYRYDALGRLVKELYSGGTEVYSFYEGLTFNKIKSISTQSLNSEQNQYRYRKVHDFSSDSAGTVTKYFVWDGDTPVMQTEGEAVFLFCDRNNSVLTASDSSSCTGIHYSLSGEPYITGDAHPEFLFCAKDFDKNTGLCNYGCRFYSTHEARFISEDPIKYGTNWYAYASNDSVNFTDSGGLKIIPPDILHTMSVYGGKDDDKSYGELLDNTKDSFFYLNGCYVTFWSGAINAILGTTLSPLDINRERSNFNKDYSTEIDNKEIAKKYGLTYKEWREGYEGLFADIIDALDNATTEYVLAVQVTYTDKDPDAKHFVGVKGRVITIDGKQYVEIEPTSYQDKSDVANLGGNRSADWIKKDGKTYVPVERIVSVRAVSAGKAR